MGKTGKLRKPRKRRDGKSPTTEKVVFLDRDGVINKKMPENDYVKNWDEFEFLPRAIEALKLLQSRGYKIFIITNQRGVARGFMSEADLKNIHKKMLSELQKNKVAINGIYYCPHDTGDNCECRKPKPGLLLTAARDHHIDLTKAVFIGDDAKDAEAGGAAGCKTILVRPGRNLLSVAQSLIK